MENFTIEEDGYLVPKFKLMDSDSILSVIYLADCLRMAEEQHHKEAIFKLVMERLDVKFVNS